MDQEPEIKKPKKILSGRQLTRQDIVEAVTDPDSVFILEKEARKSLVIPTASSIKPDIEKLIKEMDVPQGTLMDQVVRLFCQEKKVPAVRAQVFIVRIRNLNDEQLKIVGLLCQKNAFTATNILNAIQSIRRFDGARLLALRAFIDLQGIGPGPLNQFFMTTLPQGSPEEMGKEAYQAEVREKVIRADQNNAFYTLCYQVEGIDPAEAIPILRTARKLKPQHSELINNFLRKGAVFGDKPISGENVHKLVKLIGILPEFKEEKKFRRLIRQLTRKSDKRQDFQFILQAYREAILKEKSGNPFLDFIKRLFGG